VVKYEKSAGSLSKWMKTAIPQGLTVMLLAEPLRKRLRTSNMCESLNRQIKRRTRVAGLFPNVNSVLRLVTAILMETSEEWETGKSYLTLTAPHSLQTTRNQQDNNRLKPASKFTLRTFTEKKVARPAATTRNSWWFSDASKTTTSLSNP
jgi:hypothetical protein